jgi:DNA (cytosine-5)-methyltransferase 1
VIVLDLFCGAGGASVGYARAGYEVVGVDLIPQPSYPFDFVQADALVVDLDGFDLIHASPPCERWSRLSARWGNRADHPNMIADVRRRLAATGVPYVIENVRGAPLLDAVQFCGSGFGLRVRRHRLFESSVAIMSPGCAHGVFPFDLPPARPDRGPARVHSISGHGGNQRATVADWRVALGLDPDHAPSTRELADMIPPAYTESIGDQIAATLRREGTWRN